MKQKLFLYVIIILKYLIVDKNDWRTYQILEYYHKDNEFLAKFSTQISPQCEKLLERIVFSENLKHSLNSLFGSKHIFVGHFVDQTNTKIPIVIKYFGNDKLYQMILDKKVQQPSKNISNGSRDMKDILNLKELFFNESHLEGTKFCPESGMTRFLQLSSSFNHHINSITLKWIYLNINIQLLLLPILNLENHNQLLIQSTGKQKYRIPKIYEICGSTVYQSYDGEILLYFYNSSFQLKLKITKQLIAAMLQFSEGIKGFRIYLTDFHADNIVFNEATEEISFIDLDNVIIVDSKQTNTTQIHTHEIIDCPGCFAYVPSEICSAHLSDLNVFALCQFLRENLHKDHLKGFLYPIPEKFQYLSSLLDTCMDCPKISKCLDRFIAIRKLQSEIKRILSDIL